MSIYMSLPEGAMLNYANLQEPVKGAMPNFDNLQDHPKRTMLTFANLREASKEAIFFQSTRNAQGGMLGFFNLQRTPME